jgi:hypothetical protein
MERIEDGFLVKVTSYFAKTIVFCVDQEHAGEMRQTLDNLIQTLSKTVQVYFVASRRSKEVSARSVWATSEMSRPSNLWSFLTLWFQEQASIEP